VKSSGAEFGQFFASIGRETEEPLAEGERDWRSGRVLVSAGQVSVNKVIDRGEGAELKTALVFTPSSL
jgi:hypothetical protein